MTWCFIGYCFWRKDGDTYVDLFAENGEWKLAAMHMKGREEIRATFGKLLGYTAQVQIVFEFFFCVTPKKVRNRSSVGESNFQSECNAQ